ncbi:MAG: selenide, water dikinase SelD [Bacteroidales bacterium]|jgi:selenide,water dikinase|nr:selenide, water dikinase SelD [Bacteroidales bacterium]
MTVDLLDFSESGGCSAKISPKLLEEFLQYLPFTPDPNILVGIDTHDDAGVYRVNDDLALVFTTDFFPPVCSDPYEFGQIAAANSISDVYAMGATPVIALNLMMFPSARLPLEAYASILRGGSDKAAEAGMRIIGGHTIDDNIPKYGLAVIGYVHPKRIITNSAAESGDLLILTKPIGTGVILAGQKLKMAADEDISEAKTLMKSLNAAAAGVMQKFEVKTATDVTGFGLAGHALKMARAGNVTIEINLEALPLIGGAYRLADEGCIPGAAFRNLDFVEDETFFSDHLDYNLKMLSMDAQTSGGILMSVRENKAEDVVAALREEGMAASVIIGRVVEKEEKHLRLLNQNVTIS